MIVCIYIYIYKYLHFCTWHDMQSLYVYIRFSALAIPAPRMR